MGVYGKKNKSRHSEFMSPENKDVLVCAVGVSSVNKHPAACLPGGQSSHQELTRGRPFLLLWHSEQAGLSAGRCPFARVGRTGPAGAEPGHHTPSARSRGSPCAPPRVRGAKGRVRQTRGPGGRRGSASCLPLLHWHGRPRRLFFLPVLAEEVGGPRVTAHS